MSRFSGKCDFYDLIDIHGVDKILSCDIYNYKDLLPLRIDSAKDFIPYYPYLTPLVNIGKNSGYLRLSQQSFIDQEEQDRLTTHLNFGIKEYKRCKRNNIPITTEAILNRMSNWLSPLSWQKELAERIVKDGLKANINGIHTNIHNHYRYLLYIEMITHGYPENISKLWLWNDPDFDIDKLNLGD